MSEKLRRGPRTLEDKKWTAKNVSQDRRERLASLGLGDTEAELNESLGKFEQLIDLLPRGSVKFRELPDQKYREFAIRVQGPEERERIVEILENIGLMPWHSDDFGHSEIILSHPSDISIVEQLGLTDLYEGEQYAPKADEAPEVAEIPDARSEEERGSVLLKRTPFDAYPARRSAEQFAQPIQEEKRKAKLSRSTREALMHEAATRTQLDAEEMDAGLRDIVDRFDLGFSEEDEQSVKGAFANVPSLALFPRKYSWSREDRRLYRARTGSEVTAGQQHRLNMLAKNDDRALKECVDMNIGLVVWCLPAMQRKYPRTDPDDLFQAGLIGLVRALQRYGNNEAEEERDKIEQAQKKRRRRKTASDSDKVRAGWTSYMIHYIESEMRKEGLKATPVVQRGFRGVDKRRAYFKGLNALKSAFPERAIRREELRTTIHGLGLIKSDTDVALDKFERAYWLTGVFAHDEPALLDAAAAEHAVDMHGNPMADNPATESLEKRKKVIDKALSTLTPREERILRLRFGLIGGTAYNEDKTLEEVGDLMNVNKERIRQIEAKALRKLKHPSRSRLLRAVFDGSYPSEYK